jgi:hypothetical protein
MLYIRHIRSKAAFLDLRLFSKNFSKLPSEKTKKKNPVGQNERLNGMSA